MKRRFLTGLATGLLMLCMTTMANASVIAYSNFGNNYPSYLTSSGALISTDQTLAQQFTSSVSGTIPEKKV